MLQFLLIRFLSAVFPKAGALQLDAGGVSRDPVEVERYLNDPMVYTGKLSARMVAELFKAMEHIQAYAADITLPLLILHGGADSLASPEGSRFLDSHVSSSVKTLKIYPELYHEIFNEHRPLHDDFDIVIPGGPEQAPPPAPVLENESADF